MKRAIFLSVCILFLCGSILSAQEETVIPDMLGLGALAHDDAYKGKDTQVLPMPIIWWQHGNLYVRGSRAGVILGNPDSKVLECSLFLEPRFMGYDSDDSNNLFGMDDREYSLDAGIGVEWPIPHAYGITLDTSFAADILGENEGQEVKVALTKLFDFKPFFFKPRLGVAWQSQDLVDYYYGVRSQEATAARPAFSPNDAFNPALGLDFYVGLSEEWMLISRVNVNFLDSEISDSPIVEGHATQAYLIGVARMF